MKISDYKTIKQASDYQHKRFSQGLEVVHYDEINLLRKWMMKIPRPESLIYLDLGSGTGRIVAELLKSNPNKIYALDSSQAMLSLLEKSYRKQIKNVTVETIVASADKIPLPKASVDIVTSFHLFKHIQDINPTVREVRRVLISGGFFIFDVLNINSVVKFNLGSCYALSKSQIIRSLTKNGFKIIKIIPLHTFGETVYNLLGSFFIRIVDKFIIKLGFEVSTKFIILAQKNE